MIANGQHGELLDRIYSAYVSYKEDHDLVLVEGPGPLMGGTELDAQVCLCARRRRRGVGCKPRYVRPEGVDTGLTNREAGGRIGAGVRVPWRERAPRRLHGSCEQASNS
jgi:hypothetical protein